MNAARFRHRMGYAAFLYPTGGKEMIALKAAEKKKLHSLKPKHV